MHQLSSALCGLVRQEAAMVLKQLNCLAASFVGRRLVV